MTLKLEKTCPVILFSAALGILLAAIASILVDSHILIEWHLLTLGAVPLKITLILDSLSLLYSSVVLFISSNVTKFSKFYIQDDMFSNRFTILVLLFVISINMLIFIPHFIALLLGWDGLGLTSFILIIYYQNPKSLRGGILTALTNRLGDVLILVAIATTLNQGHWNIIYMYESSFMWPQILIITLAAITKRAQIPFSSWLPAAMAAPTPVSALVHSSTLVTAGVFLLIRFYPFLRADENFNRVLIFASVSTMLIAGIRACTECDIKKIIALSTLSQLGIIMIRLALGAPDIAIFHIITHALFKALLFICAGEMIYLHRHGQDLRWLGNLTFQIPITSSCIFVSNSALCGIPFMAGFYSKDLIIESMLMGGSNLLILVAAFGALGLTSFYSVRFSLSILWAPHCFSPKQSTVESVHVTIPIITISSISVMGGSIIIWTLPKTLAPSLLSPILKILPLIIVLAGGTISYIIYQKKSKNESLLKSNYISNFASCGIWFLTPLSTQLQLPAPLTSGHTALKTLDQGWLEWAGGLGLNTAILRVSSILISRKLKSPRREILKCFITGLTILFFRSLICWGSLN